MASLAAERSTYGHVVIVIAIVIERVTTSVKHKRYVVDLQTVQLSGLLARERARPALLYLSPPLWQTPSGVGGLLLLLIIIITINIHININIRIKRAWGAAPHSCDSYRHFVRGGFRHPSLPRTKHKNKAPITQDPLPLQRPPTGLFPL